MNYREAAAAIGAILDQCSESDLPEPSRIADDNEGRQTLWFGGHGLIIGSTKIGGKPARGDYRNSGISQLLEYEFAHRAENRLWDERESQGGAA